MVSSIAPFPESDAKDLPLIFIAIIFATIEAPQAREYGGYVNLTLGIVHYLV